MNEVMAGRKLTVDIRLIKCKYLEDVIECKAVKFYHEKSEHTTGKCGEMQC